MGVPTEPCSDRCPISMGTAQALPQAQGAVAQAVVEQKVETMSQYVADIRWTLIEERFAVLDQEASERGWAEEPPVEGDPSWGSYQEWLYIKAHRGHLRTGQQVGTGSPSVRELKAAPSWKH